MSCANRASEKLGGGKAIPATVGIASHKGRAHLHDKGRHTHTKENPGTVQVVLGLLVQSGKGSSAMSGQQDMPFAILRAKRVSVVHPSLLSGRQDWSTSSLLPLLGAVLRQEL